MKAFPGVETADLSLAADAAHAVSPWVAVAYLAAGVLFILALRGLSSPATSRRGNRFGMVGMLIAVVTTLVTHIPAATTSQAVDARLYDADWSTLGQILAAISGVCSAGVTDQTT